MRVFVGEDKPTIEDALIHYGVLGMKWGQRRRATGTQIRAARRNLQGEQKKLFQQQDRVTSSKGTAREAGEKKKLGDMKVSFLNNPDRVIAARMTRGEKAATLILTGLASPAAFGIGVGAIAGTSAASRRIEQRQDDKSYKK